MTNPIYTHTHARTHKVPCRTWIALPQCTWGRLRDSQDTAWNSLMAGRSIAPSSVRCWRSCPGPLHWAADCENAAPQHFKLCLQQLCRFKLYHMSFISCLCLDSCWQTDILHVVKKSFRISVTTVFLQYLSPLRSKVSFSELYQAIK